MSKLLAVLYEVAEIRAQCQQVHNDRFGLSLCGMLRALRGTQTERTAAQCAELERLRSRLERAAEQLDALDERDLAVRCGREISETLGEYIHALDRSVAGLEHLCSHPNPKPALPTGDDSVPFKVVYDDALQRQKQLAVRLNALIAGL